MAWTVTPIQFPFATNSMDGTRLHVSSISCLRFGACHFLHASSPPFFHARGPVCLPRACRMVLLDLFHWELALVSHVVAWDGCIGNERASCSVETNHMPSTWMGKHPLQVHRPRATTCMAHPPAWISTLSFLFHPRISSLGWIFLRRRVLRFRFVLVLVFVSFAAVAWWRSTCTCASHRTSAFARVICTSHARHGRTRRSHAASASRTGGHGRCAREKEADETTTTTTHELTTRLGRRAAGAVQSETSPRSSQEHDERGGKTMGFASHTGVWAHTLQDDGKTVDVYYWTCCGPRHPASKQKDSECPVVRGKEGARDAPYFTRHERTLHTCRCSNHGWEDTMHVLRRETMRILETTSTQRSNGLTSQGWTWT